MDIEMIGMFAISLAGHDKGQMYLIIKEDEDFFYLADGRLKTLGHLKKKRKKHVQIIKKDADAVLTEKLLKQQTIVDEEIRYAVKTRTNRR